MKKRFIHSDHIKWCCDDMKMWMYDNRFPLDVSIITKTYFLPIMWPHGGTDLQFHYCPWCGKYLESLHDAFEKVLKEEYGIDNWLEAELPKEFESEEWWVKRGL